MVDQSKEDLFEASDEPVDETAEDWTEQAAILDQSEGENAQVTPEQGEGQEGDRQSVLHTGTTEYYDVKQNAYEEVYGDRMGRDDIERSFTGVRSIDVAGAETDANTNTRATRSAQADEVTDEGPVFTLGVDEDFRLEVASDISTGAETVAAQGAAGTTGVSTLSDVPPVEDPVATPPGERTTPAPTDDDLPEETVVRAPPPDEDLQAEPELNGDGTGPTDRPSARPEATDTPSDVVAAPPVQPEPAPAQPTLRPEIPAAPLPEVEPEPSDLLPISPARPQPTSPLPADEDTPVAPPPSPPVAEEPQPDEFVPEPDVPTPEPDSPEDAVDAGGDVGDDENPEPENQAPVNLRLLPQTVTENTEGTVIGTIEASDPEAGDLSYAVDDPRFEVVGDQVQLREDLSLDHEAEPTITLQITATDEAGLSTTETVTVTVEDLNEAPEALTLSGSTISENAPGAAIGTLAAVDPDGDTPDYSVDDTRFEVVGDTLKLRDGVSLDFEEEPNVTLQVTATDEGGASTTETFVVDVADVNEAPTGLSLTTSVISENEAGAIVGEVQVSDPEGGGLRYAVDDSRFEMIGNQLKLRDGFSLDYEAEASVSLQITATDEAGLSTQETVTLTVADVDETPAQPPSPPPADPNSSGSAPPEALSLSGSTVAENAAGAAIGVLSARDPDGGSISYAVDDARFEVVGDQLKLRDGQSLDHEAAETVTVEITATDDAGERTTQTFDLTVTDVDETSDTPPEPDPEPEPQNLAPTAPQLSATVISENEPGANIGTVTASDPEGASLTFTVDDPRFEIVGDQLKLRDGTELDHETEDSVQLQITATDDAGLSSTETVTLTVEDVNEAPAHLSLTGATITENTAGATVGSLSATDPEGDPLTYTVDDPRFEVAGTELKLKDGLSLDHESESSVTLQVTATDIGGLSTTETLTVTVADMNEAPGTPSLSATTVAENAAGATVGTILAEDPEDDGLSYSVDDARFEVVGNALKLRDGIALDHETEANIELEITATDPGGLATSRTVTLTVTDVAEDAPDPAPNTAPEAVALSNNTVAENEAGASIGTLTATDSEGGTLTYSVDDARFEVVGDQLKLRDGASLDHESNPEVTLQITATDDGGLSTTETITISVSDVNEAPVSLTLTGATVAENAPGASIGTLSATDPEASALTYSVDDSRFEVVGDQLKLRDGVSLDHEGEDTVTLDVSATDDGGLSTTETMTVTVSDVNEAPVDLALSNDTLAENAAGAVVGQLSATDPDGDALTYTVDDTRFEVVGSELKLRDGVTLDHEASDSVTVEVTATDGGGLTTSKSFALNVNDVNEAPVGLSLDGNAIQENLSGATVGTLTATDPEGSAVSYSVDDVRFEAVEGTLKLRDGESLDHEAEPTVTLQLTARDAQGLETDTVVTVDVTDVNEAPIDLALSGNTLAENVEGAAIGTLSATDPDGDNLSYSVDDTRFEVTGDTLKLRDGVSLDHEMDSNVTVNVTASDPDGETTSESFVIAVGDEVTPPPQIDLGGAFRVQQFAVVDGVTDLAGIDFGSDPLGEVFVKTVDFEDSANAFVSALPQDVYATLVTGHIEAPEAGTYAFKVSSPDTAILWIDGNLVGIETLGGLVDTGVVEVHLDAGVHDIAIKHLDLDGDTGLSLTWKPEGATTFTPAPASETLVAEEGEDLAVMVDVDLQGQTSDQVLLHDVPPNWIVTTPDGAIASDGDPIDLTGQDISELLFSPPMGAEGTANLRLDVTTLSESGEPATTSAAFDIAVEPSDGILAVELDVSLALTLPSVGADSLESVELVGSADAEVDLDVVDQVDPLSAPLPSGLPGLGI